VRRQMKASSRGPVPAGRNGTVALFVFTLLFAFAPSASAAPKQIVNTIGLPESGEAGGLFRSPQGVAVNQTGSGGVPAGTFYVVDSNNRRIQRFGPTGAFISAWGFGVRSGNPEFEICTKAEECRRDFGGGEGAAGSFGQPQGIAVDQAGGNVYVSDPGLGRINVFSAKGAFEGAFGFGAIDGNEEFQFCTSQTGCHNPNFFAREQGGAFPGAIGGLAVDAAGNVYVANTANRRVDVFDPTLSGSAVADVEFLRAFGWGVSTGAEAFEVCTEAATCREGLAGPGLGEFGNDSPSDVAVDSEGNVFALDAANQRVESFNSIPEPLNATFGSAALEAVFGSGAPLFNIAIDPSATPNHLFVSGGRTGSEGKVAVVELDGLGDNALGVGKAHGEDLPIAAADGLAVAQASIGGNLYLSTETVGVLRGAYVLNEVPTIEPVTDITGTTATFKGKVVSNNIGVTYHFEYSTDGKTWTSVPASEADAGVAPETILVEAEAEGLTGSQLYRVRLVQNRPLGGGIATSAETTFTTLAERPAIEGTVASPVKDTSATFNAHLDPQNETTSYRFEYGLADCSANPCTALPVSQASGGGLRLVTQTATGLEPGTLYHFRLVATNGTGTTVGPDRTFETFTAGRQLPDSRAYELVTPSDTGAVVLAATGFGEVGSCFDMFPVTADGDSVVSMSKGGSLPGLSVNGRWDLYRSVRGPNGWNTVANSATAAQTNAAQGGLCVSPDHLYSTLITGPAPGDQGSLVVEGRATNYLREPDGTFALIGQGSLGIDPEANARWVTSNASHIVFTSEIQLELEAPASGTQAVYDRALGGPTHVVSLLPGDATPAFSSFYQGVSADGSVVLFSSGATIGAGVTLFARIDRSSSITVAGGSGVVAGATLGCTAGPASAATKNFQWLRNGTPIPAATSPSYTIVPADAGTAIQCQVFAINANAGSTQVSNPAIVVEPVPATAPPTAPNSIAQPAQSGAVNVPGPSEDRTLTCNPGAWSGSPTFAFQWYQNGVAIPGAIASTYVVTAGSLTAPAAFQCAVTGTNAGGSVTKVSGNRLTSPSPSGPAAPNATSTLKSMTVEPAGVSRDGDTVFYLQSGNIVAVDTATEARSLVANSGDAAPVNISDDGSHVYFISDSALTGTEENDQGQKAQAGENNLYIWDKPSEAVHFIAIVDPQDIAGKVSLTNWTSDAVSPNQNSLHGRVNNPSRTTPDGSVLLFESRANVTDYDSDGHIEIYRYDAGSGSLDCVSCPPTGVPATADAALQRLIEGGGEEQEDAFVPTTSLVHIQNVTDDGEKVFFQTRDALVPGDVNGVWDVYEWKVGQQPYLISSGHGGLPSFLYGMTPSGNDVFFTSAERLVPQDLSTVISIYDAREGGGFPVSASVPACQGENCQGTPSSPPQLPGAGSATFQGPGNETRKRKPRCSKNQRRVKRRGKVRCVRKPSRRAKKRQQRADNESRGVK
jgi:hypothetical protein